MSLYESQMKALKKLIESLKDGYLERLLGDDVYRELVLLESMKRKRPGEEEEDNSLKRCKVIA